MRFRALAATAALLLAWQSRAVAGDPGAAREQLKIGYTLAQEGKAAEAIPHLVESLRLDPKAITLINLADCEEKVGKLTGAMGHWVDARARAQIEGNKPIEEEATARATALEPRLAKLTIVLAPTVPKDAVVERDGVVLGAPSLGIPLPLDPGAHTVTLKSAGRADAPTSLTLAEGEAKRIEIGAVDAPPAPAPAPAPASSKTSPLVFVGFGIAAAGVAIGTATGIAALGAGSEAKDNCPGGTCTRQSQLDDIDGGRTMGTVSTAAFVVAGVGAALGVYGLVWGGKKTSDPSLAVSLAPANFALRGRF